MPYIVRDYSSDALRWVYWKTSSIATAYQEYPSSGVPSVSTLSGKLDVLSYSGSASSGGASDIPESSMWVLDGEDLYPSYVVNGHTGLWALEIRKQELLAIGILSDEVDTNVELQSLTSANIDADGNIIFTPDFNQTVVATDADGDISFQTSFEYDINNVVENIPQTAALPREFAEVLPSDTVMPDKHWLALNNDLILR